MAQLTMVNRAYGVASKTINIFIVIFALIIFALNTSLMFVAGSVAEIIAGMKEGITSSAFIVIAIILVPIARRLRMRMNELIDEMHIKD